MKTVAKFYVAGVTLLPGKESGVEVNLSAVSRGDRNASWAKATPCGTMKMTINNPAAAQAWIDFQTHARETGKQPELFIDIYPSTDGWPGDGHLYRDSEIEEGNYGWDKCGECSMPKEGTLSVGGKPSDQPLHPNG